MLVKEETIQVYCEGCEKSGPHFEIISFLLICKQVLGRSICGGHMSSLWLPCKSHDTLISTPINEPK